MEHSISCCSNKRGEITNRLPDRNARGKAGVAAAEVLVAKAWVGV